MYTNLVCTSGLELKCHICVAVISFDDSIMRDCFTSALHDCHFFSIRFVAGNRLIHRSGIIFDRTNHNRFIAAIRRMRRNLSCQALMCGVIFRHNEQTAGILINTMHNARSMFTVNARKTVTTVVHQCIYQRAVPVAGRRMHNHAAWLVDHHNICILINNIQRNILRLEIYFL